MLKSFVLGGMAVALAAAIPAYAHHSYAMFDDESELTLEGTIKEFQWTNPHSWIHIYVPDEAGEEVVWSIETGAPGGLFRSGWRPDTILPGDKVTFTFHPLRNGEPGGSLMTMVLPNGTVMD